jgi:hypothetical protein
VSATPRQLYPRERDPVVCVEEAGLAPWPVWTGLEYLAPTGIRSSDRPARIEFYTDFTIPAPRTLYRLHYPGPSYFIPTALSRPLVLYSIKIRHTIHQLVSETRGLL